MTFAVVSNTPMVDAHSWVEQLQRLAKNGTMLAPLGYQRGYVARDNPVFKGDISDDLWQLPPNARGTAELLASDPICSPQQSGSNYTDIDFPKLVTSPGDWLALQYQENGHVSLPTTQANKPRNRGTVYIYGTEQAKPNDTLLAIHNVWNVDGTGGDGRGRLIATRNYDDGQCYQTNNGDIAQSRMKQFSKVAENPMGSDMWCQSDIQLPTDITTGAEYTLYWVWDWPTLSKADAMIGDEGVEVSKPEIYTSCIDMQIVDPCSEDLGDVKSPACQSSAKTNSNFANSFIKDQNLGFAGVPQQLTGNFAVGVDGVSADSGSNNGLSAPPDLAVGGAATATGAGATATGSVATPSAASTFQTVTTPASKVGGTVGAGQTVTVAMSTVYITQVSKIPLSTYTQTVANNLQGVETVIVTADAVQSTLTAVLATEDSNGNVGVPVARPTVTPIMRRGSRMKALN